MKPKQEAWNERIKRAGTHGASKFSQDTIQRIAAEGGSIWRYEGPSYNTDAYREGWDRIFGNKDGRN